ncbi:RsmE family RNA methyltransferase [Miltoncostaea marina]|uniref:RsmE family RNA methyltransferase n=1 Tax=Miltoncostaea marina TaxID=2843215 RepID=UPI001C3D85DE|nr:RsmE family RNA methyltransferase [Miltoncostaea marina]
MRHVFRYPVAEPPAAGRELDLSPEDSHHLARVVRRRPGDPVEVIGPDGRLWPATVVRTGPVAAVRVEPGAPRAPRAAPVALRMGLAEWGRLDTAVEKAVELGVAEVGLFTSERVRRVPDADAWERRRARLERVALAAARQCGRAPLAGVTGLVPLTELLDGIPAGEGYLIDPRGDAPLTTAIADGAPAGRVELVVGPDAGFSDGEVARARAAGLRVCRLGDAILRAETAAIAAVTVAVAAGWAG